MEAPPRGLTSRDGMVQLDYRQKLLRVPEPGRRMPTCFCRCRRLHRLPLLVAAVLSAVCTVRAALPAHVRRTEPLNKCVVATYRISARADARAENVNCFFFLPRDEAGQEIHSLLLDPAPEKVYRDRYGRRIAHVVLPRIYPGKHAVVRWIARVSLYGTVTTMPRDGKSKVPDLSAKKRELYLSDRPKYGVRSPFIQELAARIAPADLSQPEQVRRIWRYLRENLRYERVGGWDPAETVLRRGAGSCSEYTYCLIALCRAAGIPARYIGATWCRSRRGPSFDVTHHRWGEVFLDGWGWVQIDPLKDDTVTQTEFRTLNRGLILGHGDTGDDSPMGWGYTSKIKSDKATIESTDYFWCDALSSAACRRILEASGGGNPGREHRRRPSPREAVRRLAGLGEQLCIPFLTDHLWSENARAARLAAEAICRIHTKTARHIRYNARKNERIGRILSEALVKTASEGSPLRRRRRKEGWNDLFDGRALARVPATRAGPFRVVGSRLTNSGKPGLMLSDYVTTDRCIIDLQFEHRNGPGDVALVFGHAGKNSRLEIPFYVPERPHVENNKLVGTQRKQTGGAYGVSSGERHRAAVIVNGSEVFFALDGLAVLHIDDPFVGPGRVGLKASDDGTVLQVYGFRVRELPDKLSPDEVREILRSVWLIQPGAPLRPGLR